MEESV